MKMGFLISADLTSKIYLVLSSFRQFWVVAFAAVAAGRGAEPFGCAARHRGWMNGLSELSRYQPTEAEERYYSMLDVQPMPA